jgi:hypothetical protein
VLTSRIEILTLQSRRPMMRSMRTTLHIDDDILQELKREASRARAPLRETVNRVLRLGLKRLHPASARPYQCRTFAMGFPPSANLDKALQLATLLEDEETVRKQARR